MSPQGTTSAEYIYRNSYPTEKDLLLRQAAENIKATPMKKLDGVLSLFALEIKSNGESKLIGPPLIYLQALPQESLIFMVREFNATMRLGDFLKLYDIVIDREQVRGLDEAIQFILNYIYGDNAISYKEFVKEQISKMNDILKGIIDAPTK